jgi:hypothetical protein
MSQTKQHVTNYNDTTCHDCKRETNHHKTDNAEFYMVLDTIWEDAVKSENVDFLCIGCLEKRIDRKLTPADFTGAPLNNWSGFRRSRRLRSRLGIKNR